MYISRKKSNYRIIEKEFKNNPYIPINYRRMLSEIPLYGKSILIVGANSGYEASLFLDSEADQIVGIDIITPQDMFKHRRYKFIEYDGLSMPFDDNSFDIVYSQATLEHVIDIDKTYQESLRVTKLYGHVAHLASPLWNSRDGHHRADLFESFPWCHVGRSQSQFRDWVSSSEFFKGNLSQILEAVEYCFNTSNINQSPPNDYFEAVEKLGG
jgi:SAM-dependent methyltransferase